ncbi:MAG: transglutaminase-like domain-containing protein [Bacteroidia bacterium]
MYKRILIFCFILILHSALVADIGWYLTFNGKDWNGSEAIPNNATLKFGVHESGNRSVCYNFSVAKLSLNNVVLSQPAGITNPWSINLSTALAGKTGTLTLEIQGKNCNSTANQHWIISAIVSGPSSATSTSTSTSTVSTGSTATSVPTVSAGSTISASMSKTHARTQHVVAKTSVVNKNASVSKCTVIMGYPETNAYQVIANIKYGAAVKKFTPTGSAYLEYTFTSVPANATVTAICEYDATTYAITSNLSGATAKSYVTTTQEYQRFTSSISGYCDLSDAKLKSICDPIWNQSAGNYLTYVNKCADWMSNNTLWNQSNGMKKSVDFFSTITNGKYTGDCGSLSNALSAMLRYKGVPARLLIGYGASSTLMSSSDCKNHAWMEFYLQDYGWVPVDPSFRVNSKVVPGSVPHKGIIVSTDAWYNLNLGGFPVNNTFIQSYLWSLSGNAPAGSINALFEAVSSNFKDN